MNLRIVILLTFVFGSFILSPTIISMVEKNFDISILFNVSEEENNQKEFSKNFDVKFSETRTIFSLFSFFNTITLFDFYSEIYASISQENFSPPPEFL